MEKSHLVKEYKTYFTAKTNPQIVTIDRAYAERSILQIKRPPTAFMPSTRQLKVRL